MTEIAVFKPTTEYKGEIAQVDDINKDYNLVSYTADSGGRNNESSEYFTYTTGATRRTKIKFIHWTCMSLTTGTPPVTEQLLFRIYLKGQLISYFWARGVSTEHQVLKFDEPVYMEAGEKMAISIQQLDGFPPYSLARCMFGWMGLEVKY